MISGGSQNSAGRRRNRPGGDGFAPMVSPHRAHKDKLQDAHDFMYMIDANPDIDLETLAELGDLVYPEGGKELVEKVRQVRAGEKLNL
jgi:hypothetical protein